MQPFPVTEHSLMLFVGDLASQGLKHQTLKCYLSAVRYSQIMHGLPDPFTSSLPLLDYTLKGIKRVQAERGASEKPRLPITPEILRVLKAAWVPGGGAGAPSREGAMLWAACCTGFFGFLRAAEFTVQSLDSYDPGAHLSLADVAIDSHAHPSMVRLAIKASKTDPFRKGVQVFLGRTDKDICPVAALTSYLLVRGKEPGPLFTFADGAPLSRSVLVSRVRGAISAAGLDPTPFSGHSFRIGAATTAASKGVEDSTIQTLGRWKSAAYLRYVRLSRENLAAVSKTLLS